MKSKFIIFNHPFQQYVQCWQYLTIMYNYGTSVSLVNTFDMRINEKSDDVFIINTVMEWHSSGWRDEGRMGRGRVRSERWMEVWRTTASSCSVETGTGGNRRSVCHLQLFLPNSIARNLSLSLNTCRFTQAGLEKQEWPRVNYETFSQRIECVSATKATTTRSTSSPHKFKHLL